ncbi:hypothetical protein [Noviherbaspirillum denitrificans]|uniref:hypothetical protein n=1 Tax=Noviherbaspirillum denitrificans TaxID=1968433 RepID=UPI003B3B380B
MRPEHHERQHQQRDFVPAWQYAVVDLQHVNRRHQHDQVDDRRENAYRSECTLESSERLGNFILGNLEHRFHFDFRALACERGTAGTRKESGADEGWLVGALPNKKM